MHGQQSSAQLETQASVQIKADSANAGLAVIPSAAAIPITASACNDLVRVFIGPPSEKMVRRILQDRRAQSRHHNNRRYCTTSPMPLDVVWLQQAIRDAITQFAF